MDGGQAATTDTGECIPKQLPHSAEHMQLIAPEMQLGDHLT